MALALNSNNTAPKFSLNTSKIAQGLSINLSKANSSLQRAAVKIAWIGDDLDINAACFGADGKALLNVVNVNYKGREQGVPKDLIFYQNLEQAGLKHGGDVVSAGDVEEEQILVAVQDLDPQVAKIEFIVTSHVESGTALFFKDVANMTAELVDLDTNEVLYSTDLDASGITHHTSAVFATFTKDAQGDWNYSTEARGLGQHAHGVQGILDSIYS
jgi:stress response protein SCP2